MKISFNHPTSIGRGVFLRAKGTSVVPLVALPEIRQKLGLTAAELARVLCVSRRTVEGWEQGRRISAAKLIDIRTFIETQPKLKRL